MKFNQHVGFWYCHILAKAGIVVHADAVEPAVLILVYIYT